MMFMLNFIIRPKFPAHFIAFVIILLYVMGYLVIWKNSAIWDFNAIGENIYLGHMLRLYYLLWAFTRFLLIIVCNRRAFRLMGFFFSILLSTRNKIK
jgi:hypothetical protein